MEVFARRASGLTREASGFDAFALGFMNNAIAFTLLDFLAWQPYLFPGVILWLAASISLTIVSIGIYFGILAGSMPRSGGSYIYNSRIIHPSVAIASSFAADAFILIAWAWTLIPLTLQWGLPILVGSMGWPLEWAAWVNTTLGLLIGSTIINIISFLIVLFGLKAYIWVQRVIFIVGVTGVTLALAILTINTHEAFVAAWNAHTEIYGLPTYEEILVRVAEEAPEYSRVTPNYYLALPAQSGLIGSIATAYMTSFIGGEVKRPEKNLFRGMVSSIILTCLFFIWGGYVFERIAGRDFVHALAYIYNEWPEWYPAPIETATYYYAASILVDNPVAKFLIGIPTMLMCFLWNPMDYLCFTRALFAWGMDKLGPSWFTDVNPRWRSPVKLLVTGVILGQIGLTVYCFYPEALLVYGIAIGESLALYFFTGISAIIFPFRKKVRHIWNTSPHKWKIGAIPLVTLAGIIGSVYTLMCVYFYLTEPMLIEEAFSPFWTPAWLAAFIIGLLWYFAFKWWRRKTEGLDISLAFKEIPPE